MSGWLIDTFVYTGLLIALVLVLRRPVGRAFGPQIAYALWALPFLRLLLPPIVLPASYQPADEAIVTVTREVQWTETALPVAPADPEALPNYAAPAPTSLDWAAVLEIAVMLWGAGALIFLAWRVISYHRMRRELLAEARPVGEIGRIRLVETPALAAPVAFGVLDKVIALPPLFMAQPDIAARDLAIAHELAHHRGHDLLANFAAQVLLALHWCNPLAWYGWRAMRRDQEAACDARVLSGRSRDERALYAALIADIAAGPRLALAAPMACPVLGDKSIIHRLRSMSAIDISARRRWFGRGLVAAGALALPLTASISYSAAAQGQDEDELPAAPDAPVAPLPGEAPAAPEAPVAPQAPAVDDEGRTRTYIIRRETGEDGEPVVRRFTFRGDGPPPVPNVAPVPAPRFEFRTWGDPADPDFEKKMEKWAEEMAEWGEKWGEEYGRQMEQWAERHEQAMELAEQAEELREQTQALAEHRRAAAASSSLRRARESIARNPEISEEVRREVLQDLDEEIERIEGGREVSVVAPVAVVRIQIG